MKTKLIVFVKITCCLVLICSTVTRVSAQELEANHPLPKQFIEGEKTIWLNNEVNFVTPGVKIFAPITGQAFVLHGVAYSQQELKEIEIAKSVAMQNDSVIVGQAVYTNYSEVLDQLNANRASDKQSADYILNVNVYDHGFHWATSSAGGIFVRTQAEIITQDGEQLWTQLYHLTKKEAKIPHNQKAMMFNKCVDKLLVDYENNPNLLPESYDIICGFLAANMAE